MTPHTPARPTFLQRLSALSACLSLALPLPAAALPAFAPFPAPQSLSADMWFSAPQPEALLLVQQSGCGARCASPTGTNDGPGSPLNGGLTPDRTEKIVKLLVAVNKTCGPDYVERRYRIDCLHWALWQVAQDLPQTGDYAPVREALMAASRNLAAIVQANLDSSAAPIQPNIGGKPLAAQLPPTYAVRPEKEARAIRQAARVLDETATVLLRSAENSQRRKIPYQEIAAALGSTKVLLRSA